MKFKFALKTVSATVALIAASAAQAGLFYLDNGVDYLSQGATVANGKVCATCTSMKSDFQFKYDSKTVISDTDSSGSISAGDTLVTNGGLALAGANLANNQVTQLLPAPVFNQNSNNGYGLGYLLSFKISGLVGSVTGVTGGGIPLFSYGSGGMIEMLYTTDGTNFINFMDIKVTSGGATGVSTIINGDVDFSNIDAGASPILKNLFHSGSASCGGSTSFFDIWSGAGCGGVSGEVAISFAGTQDANVAVSQFAQAGSTFTAQTNHNGSATFNIPEPTSLALVGLALFGLGVARRRNSK